MTPGAATIVILAHAGDRGADAVAAALQLRGGEVCVVRPGDLATAACWTHAIDARGCVSGELRLTSETVLDGNRVGGVLNRVAGIEAPAFARAPARERDYAAAELQALVMSWLEGLERPVINNVGGALGAPSRRQWLVRAAAAGIPVVHELVATGARLVPADVAASAVARAPWPESTIVARQPLEARPSPSARTRVLVTGDRTHGDVPRTLAGACAELGRRSEHAILELWFESDDPAAPRLAEVDPMPPLCDDGDADAVAGLLERAGTSARR